MKRSVVLACGLLMLAAVPVVAQQTTTQPTMALSEPFDSKKFFDKLQAEGVSMSSNFDSKKFFDKLQAEGVSNSKPLDAQSFFDKLQAEGVSMPANFDSKKFFDKLQAEGVSVPSMVSTSGPSAEECRAGWTQGSKWGQEIFIKLCGAIK
jgi:hypothetical protein